ncbi:unannotated protein [freshwater metagenome]|uniref:Unannotated protein n=1 Tax=freshwater metagenome TaxID=449393 RepID=A0A6J6VTP0_9ZZZZ
MTPDLLHWASAELLAKSAGTVSGGADSAGRQLLCLVGHGAKHGHRASGLVEAT